MNILLKLKHWQVFLLLAIAFAFSNVKWLEDEFLNVIIDVTGILFYMLWYFIIGLELSEYLPKKVSMPKLLFVVNGFLLMMTYLALVIIFGGSFYSNNLIIFILSIYIMYALIQFFLYTGKALKSIELNQEAGFSDYAGYTFLMIFWPVGIWWIQPKLNKIATDL